MFSFRVVRIIVAVCVVAGLGGAAGADDRPLVFYADRDYAPMSYLDNGVPKGVDVDVVAAVSRAMRRPIRIELLEWREAQERVLRGEADGLADLSATTDRRRLYEFSEMTLTHEFGLFVRAGEPTIHGVSDMAARKVGVTPGGFPREYLSHRGDATLVLVTNYDEAFDSLDAGTIDAVAADTWSASYYLQHRGRRNIAIAGPPFATLPATFAVTKGNVALLDELNRAIRTLTTDGSLAEIQQRWRPQEMVFLSRERIQVLLLRGVGIVLLVLLVGFAVWITTLKHHLRQRNATEEQLRASEEKFAKAFQASPDCIAIADLGGGGVLDINEQFELVTGYSRQEVIGRSIADLGMLVDPSARDRWLAALQRDGRLRDFEYQVRKKNGEVVDVVVSAEIIQIGGRRCFLAVNRDITDKKRAEAALRHTEARYRDLVENANDLIFTVDTDGYCLSMNRAGRDITGYYATNPRGTNLRDLVAPEHAEMAWQQLERVLEGTDVRTIELDVVSMSGKRISLEVSVRPMFENGVVVAAQGIARDISARRELEHRLRQAEKMDAVGRLAAGVAHDFNNLLTVILGHCEIGARPVSTRDPFRATLDDIRNAAERAASLTGQLLAFSRQQVIRPQVCDPNIVIAEVRRMMARLIGEDVAVQFRPGNDAGFVNADPSQLQQVVMNLAVNARDAMPEGGRLTIETRHIRFARPHVESGARIPVGDYVLLTVADTGVGMDERTREQIFEPFFTTKEVGKGTGLGLATVYGIVKQNGGFIFVDSARGLGTTFKIYLPQVATPQERIETIAEAEPVSAGHETIIVVEDEPEVRGLLTGYLESRGYTILSAENGEDAVGLCGKLRMPPALLITDIVMPGMNGRALAEQLRDRWREMRVLYVSGYSDDAVLRRGVLPNGTHLLQKPFTLSVLAGKVRDIIDGAVVQ